ncbi:MAG TPA: phytoene desaturase family protein [Candidatus Absconditabacterales bacterium]|nr:phytoene desaturase family protein [Candidatus Absconditabacterales bacterium]
MKKTITIVGGGIGGLATAILLAKQGHSVSVYEKNECLGGRASIFSEKGYTFDMGPSRYLMPDLFEEFFASIGENITDRLTLEKLSPSYKVFYPKQFGSALSSESLSSMNVYADIDRMAGQFESLEVGSGQRFKKFLKNSGRQYTIGMEFAKRNYDSLFDFFRLDIARKGLQLNIFTTIDKYVARFFTTRILQKIMQYTTVFLGTPPSQTPALYNIMSYVDFSMGVWYPKGGLHSIVQVFREIGLKYGVKYYLDSEVTQVVILDNTVSELVLSDGRVVASDLFVINADQAWFETTLLPASFQTYSQSFRDKKIFAPSGFIIYAGIDKKLPNFEHHNLYFNDDWNKSFGDIFDRKLLPEDPSIYVSMISKTDLGSAPAGKENLFVLVPIPNGIIISDEQKSTYRDKIWTIIGNMAGEKIVSHIEYERMFDVSDFKERYNAWNGTALGLAHTMLQTASFRPNNYSKKLHNLFYVGHNTNPGIGVPMVIISARLVVERMQKRGVL